jgi:hopanoid-associated phosphorylase
VTVHVEITSNRLPVLVVTGLAREMKLAVGPGLDPITSGGSPERLRALLAARVVPGCSAVLSFGIAGGLDPELSVGDVVIATGVVAEGRRRAADPGLASALAGALAAGGVKATLADIAGVDAPLFDAPAKAAVHRETKAAAVDMESHVASEFAAQHGLMFAALRIVCDSAHRSMPTMVARALRPDGGVDHYAVMADLLRRPTQIASLPRLAGEARVSFRSLGRCRDLLGIGRGLPDFVELLRNVA